MQTEQKVGPADPDTADDIGRRVPRTRRAHDGVRCDGVIGVVCIGMGNGAQECADFMREFDARRLSGEVNPAIRVVNCAVGSHAIERWAV